MKKEIIAIILFLVIMLAIFFIGRSRFEAIESGQMTLVSESQVDR